MKNLSLTLGLWVLGAAMCAAEPIELNLSSPEGTHKVKAEFNLQMQQNSD